MPIDSRAVKPPRIPEFEGSFTDRTLPELQAIAVALRGTSYPGENDWVFASHRRRGRLPYWPDMILKRHIRPLAGRLGIRKRIGWHTFRRSFATLLKANGEDVKTTQELLRHANPTTTLLLYAQAIPQRVRQAQGRVVELVRAAPLPAAETGAAAGLCVRVCMEAWRELTLRC